jgi:hypothetical protein
VYRRSVPRLGHNQAIGAIAHRQCRLIWLILHEGVRYEERGPIGQQTIKATAHLEDDPATPKPRLSDRTTESSTKPSTNAVIFDPGALPASFCVNGSQDLLVTHILTPGKCISPNTTTAASAVPAALFKLTYALRELAR